METQELDFNKLIDQAIKNANLKTDYALSKATGIPQNILSAIRKGKRHPSTTEATQLATLAGIDEMKVIAEIEFQTAKNPAKKEFWKHYIERRGLVTCITMTALAASIALAPEPATASVLQLPNYDAPQSVFDSPEIYIMRTAEILGCQSLPPVAPHFHLIFSLLMLLQE